MAHNPLIYFLRGLPIELLSYLVVPIACLFVKERDGKNRLPRWASWWDEYKHGTDGDGTGDWETPQTSYWMRVRWLLRNRANTFATVVQGFKASDISELSYTGDIRVSNRPGFNGLLKIKCVTLNKEVFKEIYYVRRWGQSNRCIRIRLGWKLKDYMEDYLDDGKMNRPTREYVQFVFSPSFTMTFSETP